MGIVLITHLQTLQPAVIHNPGAHGWIHRQTEGPKCYCKEQRAPQLILHRKSPGNTFSPHISLYDAWAIGSLKISKIKFSSFYWNQEHKLREEPNKSGLFRVFSHRTGAELNVSGGLMGTQGPWHSNLLLLHRSSLLITAQWPGFKAFVSFLLDLDGQNSPWGRWKTSSGRREESVLVRAPSTTFSYKG